MTIDLYINNSDKNVISKSLTTIDSVIGTMRNESSIISPVIYIESNSVITANYAYITEFGRYYYINDITSVRNGLWRVSMRVDVLMSFANAIKQLPVIVSNAEYDDSRYMMGSQWATTVKTKTDVISFPSGLLDTGEYILITSGGIAGAQGGA